MTEFSTLISDPAHAPLLSVEFVPPLCAREDDYAALSFSVSFLCVGLQRFLKMNLEMTGGSVVALLGEYFCAIAVFDSIFRQETISF